MMKLKCAIFDMDGTVVDVPYDWKKIKEELKTGGRPILTHIQGLCEPDKSEKWAILEKYEGDATRKAVLKKGIKDLLRFLRDKDLKTALVTNNSQKNVQYIIGKFDLFFDLILSREKGLWKPSGAPFLAVIKAFKLKKEECLVIGDTFFDIEAAKDVGIRQVLILNKDKDKFASTGAKIFSTVGELKAYIESVL